MYARTAGGQFGRARAPAANARLIPDDETSQIQCVQTVEVNFGRRGINGIRAADHQETDRGRDIPPATPRADFGERVGADDEEQLVAGASSARTFSIVSME